MSPENGSYNATVLDHFRNPRNAGELANANAVGEERNPVCGDHMRLMLRIENDVITEARFLTKGCGAAIATSSVATEMLQGRSGERGAHTPTGGLCGSSGRTAAEQGALLRPCGGRVAEGTALVRIAGWNGLNQCAS